ncbi:hypothetical protein IWW42_001488, partial [Coemansia sp. RSA 1085]
ISAHATWSSWLVLPCTMPMLLLPTLPAQSWALRMSLCIVHSSRQRSCCSWASSTLLWKPIGVYGVTMRLARLYLTIWDCSVVLKLYRFIKSLQHILLLIRHQHF